MYIYISLDFLFLMQVLAFSIKYKLSLIFFWDYNFVHIGCFFQARYYYILIFFYLGVNAKVIGDFGLQLCIYMFLKENELYIENKVGKEQVVYLTSNLNFTRLLSERTDMQQNKIKKSKKFNCI